MPLQHILEMNHLIPIGYLDPVDYNLMLPPCVWPILRVHPKTLTGEGG